MSAKPHAESLIPGLSYIHSKEDLYNIIATYTYSRPESTLNNDQDAIMVASST